MASRTLTAIASFRNCQPVYSMRYTHSSASHNGFISKRRQMQEKRTSAGMRALLLALISVAAVALLAGLFSGLDFLPFGEDNNQTTYQQPPPPPDTTISDASSPGFTVDEDNVEVRTGHSSEYPVIGVVNRGQTFTPTGRTQAGDWLQFPWEGRDGWVQVQQLTVTGLDQIPTVGRIPPPPPPDLPPSDAPPPDAPPPDSPPPDPSTPGSSPGGPPGTPPSE